MPRLLTLLAVAVVGAGCGGASAADDVGRSLAKAKSQDDAARTLATLRDDSDDHRQLVDAFCEAVAGAVSDDAQEPETPWVDLLYDTAPDDTPNVTEMLERFDAGLTIAEETNGGVALRYYQACLRN